MKEPKPLIENSEPNELDKLEALARREAEVRAKCCLEELQKVLARHNCAIAAQPFIKPEGLVVAQWGVVALARKSSNGAAP